MIVAEQQPFQRAAFLRIAHAQRLDQRLPVPPTKDEIAGLIKMLNTTFERLQRSFEQSARFSADASHHLKTPIAILRADVEEILADVNCSESTQARAEGLLHRIHQLNSVVDNLLLLSRADAGRVELSKTEFDLGEVLEGVLDDAQVCEHLQSETDRPNFVIELQKAALRRGTSVGDQNIESSPSGRSFVHHLSRGISEQKVKRDGPHFRRQFGELRASLLQLVFTASH